MQHDCFRICTDGSNDQNISEVNSVTVRLFEVNHHKVVTKFLYVCLTRSLTARSIFSYFFPDPIIHSLYDALFNWFALPEVVQKYKNGELSKMSKNYLLKYLDDLINHTPAEKVFVGFLERSKIQKFLDDTKFSWRLFTFWQKSIHLCFQ